MLYPCAFRFTRTEVHSEIVSKNVGGRDEFIFIGRSEEADPARGPRVRPSDTRQQARKAVKINLTLILPTLVFNF